MAPVYGIPNYNFLNSDEGSKEFEPSIENSSIENVENQDRNPFEEMTFWYMVVLGGMLLTWLLIFFCLRIFDLRHKTRAQPPPRAFQRARPSLSPEPTIYVSPANLPPPPKYECLAPPSYEEVVGVHYPNYPSMPITQPITTAMAQSTSAEANNVNNVTSNESQNSTVITVTSERRTVAT